MLSAGVCTTSDPLQRTVLTLSFSSSSSSHRRPLPASENAPRRPEPPSRDVVYRSASPLAMPRPSSPNVERRGSYRRYSNGSLPNMEERPRASSGLRNGASLSLS